MPNIYDGINKMSDSEIREQIALLKNITLLNVAKETGNRLLGGLTNLANAFSETFSKKTPFDYQVTKVSDLVKQETLKMASKERVQLEFELKKVLMERCSELVPIPLDLETGEDKLCHILVTEAAKTYGMEKYLTQGRKIETIKEEYQKAYLSTLHGILIRQNEEERRKTDQAIQKRLNEVSLETKRELQKRLFPKEFSGKGIARILRLEKSTKYLGYTVMLLGNECFDSVNTNIVTIMNTVKGLKRITRVLLAEFIYAAAQTYGGRFVISQDILPGYQTPAVKAEEGIKEKSFRAALQDREKVAKQLEKSNEAIEKMEHQIADTKDRLELESREYDEVQMQFMSLQSRKDDYMNGRHSQEETKAYYTDVNGTKRKLDSAESEYKKWQNKLHEAEQQKRKLETERNTAMLNFEVVKHKTERDVNQYAQALKRNWQAFYYKFTFEETVFEQVIIDFTHEEQLRIEEMLKEMHDSRDIKAYAIESETSEQENIQEEDAYMDKDSVNSEDIENMKDSPESDLTQQNQHEQDVPEVYFKTYVNVASGKNASITYLKHKIIEIKKA